jgi:tetratricopeptide (TPR) repeat protein
MLKSKKIVGMVLLAILAVPLLTSFTVLPAQDQGWYNGNDRRTANFIELAGQAREKVDLLFGFIYANDSVIETITDAGLLDDLEANQTAFDQAVTLLTEAQAALDEEDYQVASEKAIEALRIFCDVFKALNRILAEAEVQRGTLVDGQGLIEAMRRALERIERLREVLPENATEALALLEEAESYLNIDQAIVLLNEGNASQVASHLAQANKLIAEAYKALRVQARLMNARRIQNFLRGLQKIRERVWGRLELASIRGFNVTDILGRFNYANMEQFNQSLNNMIQNATQKALGIRNIVHELNMICTRLRDINWEMARQGMNGGQGNNNNDHGNGNGNGLGTP